MALLDYDGLRLPANARMALAFLLNQLSELGRKMGHRARAGSDPQDKSDGEVSLLHYRHWSIAAPALGATVADPTMFSAG